MKNRLLILFLFALITHSLSAQTKMGYEIGVQGGLSFYFGDINQNVSFDEYDFSSTVLARWIINKRTALRGQLSYGRINGDDKNSDEDFQQLRNLNFRSDIIELGAVYEFNFLPYSFGEDKDWFTPFVFIGAGAFYFNPTTELDGEKFSLRDFNTEGDENEYSPIQPTAILGIGLKYNINYRWSLNGEIGNRFTFTDYLDDISTTFPDFDRLRAQNGDIAVALSDRSGELPDAEPIGREGLQRGNSQFNDHYLFFQVGVTYHINNLKCPNPF